MRLAGYSYMCEKLGNKKEWAQDFSFLTEGVNYLKNCPEETFISCRCKVEISEGQTQILILHMVEL